MYSNIRKLTANSDNRQKDTRQSRSLNTAQPSRITQQREKGDEKSPGNVTV